MVVVTTTTAVMCRQCQAAVAVCQAAAVVVVVAVAVIKTPKSRIKEFFRGFVKKGVFADNIYVDMIAVQDYIHTYYSGKVGSHL
jgi:hypothetical protein